jgi:hypothetical protein
MPLQALFPLLLPYHSPTHLSLLTIFLSKNISNKTTKSERYNFAALAFYIMLSDSRKLML